MPATKDGLERRIVCEALLTLMVLVIAACLAGCQVGAIDKGEIDVVDEKVTERDLEVARQMSAPDQVIESMEKGEWLYHSDRVAVRFSELAIDYMRETYGQECRAEWSTVPWVLSNQAEVTLVAQGGASDGAKVTVTISNDKPRKYWDDWYAVAHEKEVGDSVRRALRGALAGIPDGSWAQEVRLQVLGDEPIKDLSVPTKKAAGLYCDVSVYLLPTEIGDEESLEGLRATVEEGLKGIAPEVKYCIQVLREVPEGDVLTVESAQKSLAYKGETMSATGVVEGSDAS